MRLRCINDRVLRREASRWSARLRDGARGFSRAEGCSMYTRREFGVLTLGAVVAGVRAHADSTVNGVRLGVQTYSFRELPRAPGSDAVDTVIKAMKECGLSECELFAPQVEPQFTAGTRSARGAPPSPAEVKARDDLRKWRIETPIEHFREVKKKFDAAGITIYAYNYSANKSYTDQEIDRGFDMAKALGAEI